MVFVLSFYYPTILTNFTFWSEFHAYTNVIGNDYADFIRGKCT